MRSKSILALLSVLLVFVSHAAAVGAWTQGNFEIHVFNVGQADSQLIVSPTGRTLLIDVGETHYSSSQGAQSVAQKIRSIMGANHNHIDYIVATHLHSDHIGYVGRGGIWALIENYGFRVGTLIGRDAGVWDDVNRDEQPTQNEITWHNAGTTSVTGWRWLGYATDPANATKLNREIAIVGSSTQIDLGPDVTVTVVQSDASGVKMEDGITNVSGNHVGETNPPSENDYSITLKVSFGRLDYVTGSDTDGEYATGLYGYTYNDVESVIAPRIGQVEVLHANHHGSAHSTNQVYVNTLDPDVSLISSGNNSYGHPDQDALNRLLATSTVYLTARGEQSRNYGSAVIVDDDIVIRSSDGVNYTVNGNPYVVSISTTEPNVVSISTTEPTRVISDSFEGIDTIVEGLEWGTIKFDPPTSMRFKETETIELLFSRSVSIQELQTQLEKALGIESLGLKISNRMEAWLSGTGFQINPHHHRDEQIVFSKGEKQWKWDVTPTKDGPRRLYLTLSAILTESNQDAPFVIRTSEPKIDVEITLANRAFSFFSKHWEFLCATILIPVVVYFWNKHRKKEKHKAV